jgi:AcrR family transcriptional regulator
MFGMPYPAKLSRPAVINAALALVDAGGGGALGMRALAEALDVRPASLYKHVGDLATLEAHLAETAAAELAARIDAVRERLGPDADPAAGLRAAADAYVGFARERPARYALLGSPPPAEDAAGGGLNTERKSLWNRLLAVVGALTGDPDDTAAAVVAWSYLHGFVTLEAAGLFGASGPRGALARGIDALARGLGGGAHDARRDPRG